LKRPHTLLVAATALVVALAGGSGAVAQGIPDSPDPNVILTFGLGAGFTPAYPGSDDMIFRPSGTVRVEFFRLPNGFTYSSLGSTAVRQGFGLYGSARYVGERDVSEYPELTGLDDVPWTFEAGLGVGYQLASYRVFGDVRYGFHGHESFVGTLGADLITRPSERLVVRFGPRAEFGSDSYASTYFGVTPAEAAAGSLPAFDAKGGLMGAGLELSAVYAFNDRWGLEGRAGWLRLLNDAADSPVTNAGNADQFKAIVILTRSVNFNF
jgi:MipA family protein